MMKPVTLLLMSVLLSLPVAAATGSDSDRIYTHRAVDGDTLIKLANRFLIRKTEWQLLQKHNAIANPNRIPVGTNIRIPVSLMRTEPASVTVESTRGRVESSAGTLAKGTTLREGDQLKTGDDGFVTIKLADGSTLTVQSKSAVRLDVMRQLANTGGVPDSVVRLDAGRLETQVAKQRGPAARYEVRTPTSNMGVRGTSFRVGADAGGTKAQSEVVEGLVAVASASLPADKRPLDIAAGFGTIVEAGKPPSLPIALLPQPDLSATPATLTTANVSLDFPAIAGAGSYRGQIAVDQAFTNIIADVASAIPAVGFDGLPDGELFFRARAIDRLGLEGKDATRPLSIKARPFAPVPELPVNNANLSSGGVTLSWRATADAHSYRIQLARDGDFGQLVEEATISAITMPIKATLSSGRYTWRVASIDAAGRAGPWSPQLAFSVATEPLLLKPKAGRKSISLDLDAARGRQVQVQVARDRRFTSLVSDQVVSAAEIDLGKLSLNVYYVRIRLAGAAVGSANEIAAGAWSETGVLEVYGGDWWLSTHHVPAR